MNLESLIPDRDALEVARAAFLLMAKDGATFETVRAVLMRGGMRAVVARRFIERMEAETRAKLPGERPAARTVGNNKRLATANRNAARLKSAQRAAGKPGRYTAAAGGRTYANRTTSSARVVFCESCGAPVVDNDAARRGHAARVGCAVI
jgi:hypothetical protein